VIKNKIKSSRALHSIVLILLRSFNKVMDKLFNKKISSSAEFYLSKTKKKHGFDNKILFVIPTLGPGGSERQLVNIANHLKERSNHKGTKELDIIIVCLKSKLKSKDFYESQLVPNIRIIKLGDTTGMIAYIKALRRNYMFFWMGKNLVYLDKLDQLIKIENPKVIHAWLDSACVCAGLSGIINDIPKIVLSTRNLNPTYFLSNRFYYRSLLKKLILFDQINILNNSRAGAKSYERWLNLRPNKVVVVKNGFDLKLFKIKNSHQSDKKYFLVGGVMRLTNEKNIKLWISVARECNLQKLNVKFLIIGDGPEKNKLKKYIQKNCLSDDFTILKPNSDVYQYMNQFDVLLLTSRFEGLPNVLIEAQLLGIPVISTNAGGAAETFLDNVSGYLLKTLDPKELVALIRRIASDEILALSLSNNAKKHAQKMFEISQIVKEYLKVYSNISI
jgi:glycosyltransferase involved in cell wall biosynthesis